MGSRYALRAVRETVGEEMPVAERATLIIMGLHALDGKGKNPDNPPGVYWGGHRQLAREVFGTDTDANMRRITRIIRSLEMRKLIAAHDTTTGYNRAYQLYP